jgi:hypothetical protein
MEVKEESGLSLHRLLDQFLTSHEIHDNDPNFNCDERKRSNGSVVTVIDQIQKRIIKHPRETFELNSEGFSPLQRLIMSNIVIQQYDYTIMDMVGKSEFTPFIQIFECLINTMCSMAPIPASEFIFACLNPNTSFKIMQLMLCANHEHYKLATSSISRTSTDAHTPCLDHSNNSFHCCCNKHTLDNDCYFQSLNPFTPSTIFYWRLLPIAISKSNVQVVAALIQHCPYLLFPTDYFMVTEDGSIPLHKACQTMNPNASIIELLIDAGMHFRTKTDSKKINKTKGYHYFNHLHYNNTLSSHDHLDYYDLYLGGGILLKDRRGFTPIIHLAKNIMSMMLRQTNDSDVTSYSNSVINLWRCLEICLERLISITSSKSFKQEQQQQHVHLHDNKHNYLSRGKWKSFNIHNNHHDITTRNTYNDHLSFLYAMIGLVPTNFIHCAIVRYNINLLSDVCTCHYQAGRSIKSTHNDSFQQRHHHYYYCCQYSILEYLIHKDCEQYKCYKRHSADTLTNHQNTTTLFNNNGNNLSMSTSKTGIQHRMINIYGFVSSLLSINKEYHALACVQNNQSRFPLHIACELKLLWSDGLKDLLFANFDAIEVIDPISGLLPFMSLAADYNNIMGRNNSQESDIMEYGILTSTFLLLQARPSVLLNLYSYSS